MIKTLKDIEKTLDDIKQDDDDILNVSNPMKVNKSTTTKILQLQILITLYRKLH